MRIIVRSLSLTFVLLFLSACGGGGGGEASVSNEPARPSIASFTVSPSSIMTGENAVLMAVFSNGSGSVSEVGVINSGVSVNVSPSTTTTYTLTVTNAAGASVTASAIVSVSKTPVLQFGTSGNDQAIYGMVLTESNDFLVAYSTDAAIQGETNKGAQDIVIAKVSQTGEIISQTQIGTEADEVAYQMTKAADGNYFLSVGSGLQGTVKKVIKFDANVHVIWEWVVPADFEAQWIYRIAPTPSGGVVLNMWELVSQSLDFQQHRGVIAQLDSSGTLEWHLTVGTAADSSDYSLFDGDWNTYLVRPYGLTVAPNGDVYSYISAFALDSPSGSADAYSNPLIHLNSFGSLISSTDAVTPVEGYFTTVRVVHLLENQNIYLGYSNEVAQAIVTNAVFDALGTEINSRSYPELTGYRYVFRSAMDSEGQIILTGGWLPDSLDIDSVWVAKFDTNLNLLWDQIVTSELPDGTSAPVGGSEPVIDSAGNVFLLSTTHGGSVLGATPLGGSDVIIVKMNGDTGELVNLF